MDELTYDRAKLDVGIVHIGVGNFHRAHQARYLDRLARMGLAEGWGICGVGLLPSDTAVLGSLAAQGHKYTLIEQHPDGQRQAASVGTITETLHIPEQAEEVLGRLANPRTRVVSLTITEGGYNINDATGEFDPENSEVKADALPGAVPRTAFGLIVAGLARRREKGLKPFAVLSCDNVEENGQVARRSALALARMIDAELAEWIAAEVKFPGTMVDRITPATTEHTRSLARDEFGVEDAVPVLAESYTQWVIEDDFPSGRPQWEAAGATIVSDVRPFEMLKLRVLNGAHQAMAYAGLLAGMEYVHEAAADPTLRAQVEDYMAEAASSLEPLPPQVNPATYQREVMSRFASPHVSDTLARLAVDGSDRIPKFVVPVIRALRSQGRDCKHSVAVIARWARYLQLATADGSTLPYTDRQHDRVLAALARLKHSPDGFLDEPRWFGNQSHDPAVRDAFEMAYRDLVREV